MIKKKTGVGDDSHSLRGAGLNKLRYIHTVHCVNLFCFVLDETNGDDEMLNEEFKTRIKLPLFHHIK